MISLQDYLDSLRRVKRSDGYNSWSVLVDLDGNEISWEDEQALKRGGELQKTLKTRPLFGSPKEYHPNAKQWLASLSTDYEAKYQLLQQQEAQVELQAQEEKARRLEAERKAEEERLAAIAREEADRKVREAKLRERASNSWNLSSCVVCLERPTRVCYLHSVENHPVAGPLIYYSQEVGRDRSTFVYYVTSGVVYRADLPESGRTKANAGLTRVVAALLRHDTSSAEFFQDLKIVSEKSGRYLPIKFVRLHLGGYQVLVKNGTSMRDAKYADWKAIFEFLNAVAI